MNPILTKILLERYPEIFVNYGGDMTKTCMAWGFEIGNGWFDIMDKCCANIQNNYENAKRQYEYRLKEYNKSDEEIAEQVEKFGEHMKRPEKPPEEPTQLVAEQVKEKYGTLRFYSYGGCDKDDGAIDMAESMSSRICDICGNPGKVNDGGWMSCRCERCQGIIDAHHEPNTMALMFEKIEQEVVERILKMDEKHKEWLKFE